MLELGVGRTLNAEGLYGSTEVATVMSKCLPGRALPSLCCGPHPAAAK